MKLNCSHRVFLWKSGNLKEMQDDSRWIPTAGAKAVCSAVYYIEHFQSVIKNKTKQNPEIDFNGIWCQIFMHLRGHWQEKFDKF